MLRAIYFDRIASRCGYNHPDCKRIDIIEAINAINEIETATIEMVVGIQNFFSRARWSSIQSSPPCVRS